MNQANQDSPVDIPEAPISPINVVTSSTPEPKNLNNDDSVSDKPLSQEDLLKAIHDKLPSAEIHSNLTLQQLEVLTVIADRLKYLEETKVEFIWGSVLQLAGLLFVVIFGVFAALAYDAAEVANRQSADANQMSLLTFCMLNPVCSQLSFDRMKLRKPRI
jgi:tetrahydromethanopterin S-methyltransferase subunit G